MPGFEPVTFRSAAACDVTFPPGRFIVPVSMIIINDVMAYMFGFFFGRTPLIKLSPKKTWEGYLGGGVATVMMGLLVRIRVGGGTDPWRGGYAGLGQGRGREDMWVCCRIWRNLGLLLVVSRRSRECR